jgi:hypothetical protein
LHGGATGKNGVAKNTFTIACPLHNLFNCVFNLRTDSRQSTVPLANRPPEECRRITADPLVNAAMDNYIECYSGDLSELYNISGENQMNWTAEAEDAIKKVPFFVRKRVRARVEKEAAAAGSPVVSLADVKTTQARYRANMSLEIKGYQIETCFGLCGCPNRAMISDQLGGKLGRHPQLAKELPGVYSEERVRRSVKDCIRSYKENSKHGKRFAQILQPDDFAAIVRRYSES